MGREFLLHLYLESPVFFQIQPGNLEQPVGTDKCSIARACTLGPSSHVFMLFIQLFIDVFKRWKQSLSPPTFHPRKPSRELAAYSGQGQEKPSTSYVPFWIRPLRLPFSWSFGGSFEWEPQNRFALLTQESWEAQIDRQSVPNVFEVKPQTLEYLFENIYVDKWLCFSTKNSVSFGACLFRCLVLL